MNIREIYVLNRALDGKDIYSLPALSDMEISDFIADAVKDELIEKGILQSHDSFTEKGVILTNYLKLFKEAGKHVKMGNIAVGLLDDNKAVALIKNPLLNEYQLRLVDSTDIVDQITGIFTFLTPSDEKEEMGESETSLSPEDFKSRYEPEPGKYLRLEMLSDSESADEIYFSHDRALYIYDYQNCVLHTKSSKKILRQLNERMCS